MVILSIQKIHRSLKLDLVSCQIFRGRKSIRLTREELGLFILLATEKAVSTDEIIRRLGSSGLRIGGVYAFINRLRAKLEKLGYRKSISSNYAGFNHGKTYVYSLKLKG